ncbi:MULTISPECIES: Tex family protein [unclassified Pseudodesulfovibrio]|uniref:Tex family protein n=1 Tax=unclassified Pseudodesulfovibrio TaxID=2661612 RepID=UPI000FEB6019|nr:MULTISPECIES: Tex family protein [unclassified Pseudodesulfovibrio]MCJ2163840.1 RNA-binding transcriptional accessory protein [Pseudodesulfovibrio sp. S3-i]RWU05913.1 RNA-binding transcriptional accessory protein [Pseudodesulfovibrio sp. S3]
MTDTHIQTISRELSLKLQHVKAVAVLLEEGATVPFISRYRKEATGTMDEVGVAGVRDRLIELAELDKRREAILSSLTERDLLTDDLRQALEQAKDKARLEDVYLPYRPKRRTRAAVAKERGLEPLANALFSQRGLDPQREAARFVNPDKDVPDVAAALAGARDIIAENINENANARAAMRALFVKRGRFVSKVAKGKEEAGATYRDWFDWDEPLARVPGHRALAMFRGENEKLLKLSLRPPEEEASSLLRSSVLRGNGTDTQEVGLALDDCYKRLLGPSIENEVRAEVKKRADAEAIGVFAANLRELLLAAPLGQKRVLSLDPGFRTGAKLTVLDAQGALREHTTIFPTGSKKQQTEACETLRALCAKYEVEAIAIGNGTAGRETETFVRELNLGIPAVLVNESGASIYSASEVARREFPDLDLTVRGSASIGRRLMDPLAELVKIDPKSIGVGQYQHDVDQTALKKSLDDVVERCVNSVGVDLNTASRELLASVSGLGQILAENIVTHRDEHGPFGSRRELLKVKRLGPKAFEQAAGFLRVKGKEVLDGSAVHPERYALVKQMAKDVGCSVADLINNETARERVKIDNYISEDVGQPTLRDIMNELTKPGRDPRAEFSAFSFTEGVNDIKDLHEGMKLPGIVTNVTKFGAFVDIGVHRDGLVHISQLADKFIRDPSEVVTAGREVEVTVIGVDEKRGRINLSMKRNAGA